MISFLTVLTILPLVFGGNKVVPEDYYKYTVEDAVHRDPDTDRNVSLLISSKGYPVEEHRVVTSDGYILGVQRIPAGKFENRDNVLEEPTSPPPEKKEAVLLHHGLLSSASDWVINLENQSLGFILADAGYDVWLANARGNTYSRKHQTLDPDKEQFWKFSWDEIARYDVPATIDYVLKTTGRKKLHYVGHSMGTTVIFALLSQKEEYNDKIKSVMALAPVATVSRVTSPVKYLAPFTSEIQFILKLFGEYEFLPSDRLMKFLSSLLCANEPFQKLCENVIFLIAGPESHQFNESRLEVITHHAPAGTSSYTVIHYAQMVRSKSFQMFDYGKKGNIEKYGQDIPPRYPVEKMTAPVALFWSVKDALADPDDVLLLKARIGNLIDWYRVADDKWSHLDYVYGVDADQYVYRHLLKLLKSYR